MTLAVRRGWDPYNSLIRQMDRDFDKLVRRSFGGRTGTPGFLPRNGSQGFVPAVNVTRDDTDVVLQFELPGIDASDVDVEVTEGRLVVSGKREDRTEQDDESGVLIREIRSGEFRREFALPEHVTGEQLEASYDKGVLTVRVQDVQKKASEPTKIEVTSS